MEFVGKAVKKNFKGHGVFTGIVKSYDALSGFFEIVYEDGDLEELDFSEVVCLLEGKEADPVDHQPRLGRKSKKRRLDEPPRKRENGDSGNSCTLVSGESNENLDMNRNVDLNDGFVEDFRESESDIGDMGCVSVDLNETLEGRSGVVESSKGSGCLRGGLKKGFDLNAGFNLNLNEGFDLNEVDGHINVDNVKGDSRKRECIDLNLDVNDIADEDLKEVDMGDNGLKTQKRECGFDLNLGIDEELKDDVDINCGGKLEESTSFETVKGGTQKTEEAGRIAERWHDEGALPNGTLEEVHVYNDSCRLFAKGIQEEDIVSGEDFRTGNSGEILNVKVVKEGWPGVIDGQQGNMTSPDKEASGNQKRRRGRRKKLADSLNSAPESIIFTNGDDIREHCPMLTDGNQGHMPSAYRETSGCQRTRMGRKKKLADTLNPSPDAIIFTDANDTREDSTLLINGNQVDVRHMSKEATSSQRGRRKLADNLSSMPETMVIIDANGIKEDSTMVIEQSHGDMGSSYKEVSGSCRKRRKLSDEVTSMPEKTVLRRSARRGSAKDNMSSMTTSIVVNNILVSPAVSALTEKPLKSHSDWSEKPVVVPPKVQLPPSSRNLDLGGIPILDLFSVYACLRSFSTLLFLSPFELEEFVAALKCNTPSSLFDCIHVALLQTLRKHLEYLSNEGSESASDCLRNLNWSLLDLITWPVFMVEYLLIHGSGLKPGFDLNHLKLFKSDYHKQPISVKVEILRCLCDDMIEVEAIRSELNRRFAGGESDLEFDRNVNIGGNKKRRAAIDVLGGPSLTEEAADDTADWNSDECCLCKMDGSLICCDGCPAAYHSKCVGVSSDSLPEGDWYCHECAIDKHKPWMKPRKSLRGAELLGVDPYGRLYFSSSGYLLVSDSCDTEFSFNYYHKDDLNAVIEVLKSLNMSCHSIWKQICRHWDVPVNVYGAGGNLNSLNHTVYLDKCMSPAALASSETCVAKETSDGRKPDKKFRTVSSGHLHIERSKFVRPPCMSSEGSAETTQMSSGTRNFQKEGTSCSNRSADFSNESEIPGKCLPLGVNSLTSKSLDIKQEKKIVSGATGHASPVVDASNGDTLQVQPGTGYTNYYSFGHIASSIAEVLMGKSSDKTFENSIKSDEELISAQMKVISKKSTKFRWPSIPSLYANVQKEKCGWCFSCRVPTDDLDCLFNMSLGPVQEGSVNEAVSLQLKRNRKGHLVDVIYHMLLVEERLQGLLLGPWLNPQYTRIWHKNILKASDIVSVKRFVLMLESNLHPLALSVDWLKHVDSAATMGSASHLVTSLRASLKNGIGRKKTRSSEPESNSSSNSASGLGMFWWRGGRISRKLFNWKVLPCSLVSKAARQAGCVKIPGILYPENSDFAKRSNSVAWRAAVESSTTVEQLALQVRELDLNIRWDEIENTHLLPMLDKESRKSIRLFKKVIIRRKCLEGERARYLLDFGKRRSIPEVVLKNGSVVEESSSERKKYWLNESYVPLHLVKSFEEKKIVRKSGKMSSGKLSEGGEVGKKSQKKRDFSYLFAKAERSLYHQCGHCNKDVLIREAVSCQHCNGFFHKRHVKKSAGSITAECIYTCHRCQNGKHVKTNMKRERSDANRGNKNAKSVKVRQQKSKKSSLGCKPVQLENTKKALRGSQLLRSQKNKRVAVVPLRRSARTAKYKALQKKKVGRPKKGKQVKSRKGTYKKPKKVISWRKKRTQTYHSYWLNGLKLSRKPDDERALHFRKKRFLGPFESVILDQPKCNLCCKAAYSTSNYISCEMCGEWFHGDAFGLDAENIGKLIGFRCHMCRKRAPPVCPQVPAMKSHETQTAEGKNDVEIEFSKGVTEDVVCPTKDDQYSLPVNESLHKNEHLSSVLDYNLSSVAESRLAEEINHLLGNEMENSDAIRTSTGDLKPDLITSSNDNHMLQENMIESGNDAFVTSHDDAQPSSACMVDVDVIETELVSLGPDSARDDLTEPILKSPIDGTLCNSIKLHPQPFMTSSEL